MGKSEIFFFLETIAALGRKVDWSISLNELMMLNEYQSQGHYLTVVKGPSDFKVKTCLS